MTSKEKAKAGATLLDDQHPGWHRQVYQEDLVIRDPANCILGQLYGGYRVGLTQLELDQAASIYHGFSTYPAEQPELEAAWRAELDVRLSLDRVERTMEVELVGR